MGVNVDKTDNMMVCICARCGEKFKTLTPRKYCPKCTTSSRASRLIATIVKTSNRLRCVTARACARPEVCSELTMIQYLKKAGYKRVNLWVTAEEYDAIMRDDAAVRQALGLPVGDNDESADTV